MKKILTTLMIILFVGSVLNAAEYNKDNANKFVWPKNRLGATASTFTGYGLTYYRHFADKFAAKICLFAFGDSRGDVDDSEELNGIIGTELQYTIHKTDFTRLHIFTSFSYWYYEYKYSYIASDDSYSNVNIERNYVPGIGFGFEFLAWKVISFNIETGLLARFGVETDYGNQANNPYNTTRYPKSYGFGIGAGITYAF